MLGVDRFIHKAFELNVDKSKYLTPDDMVGTMVLPACTSCSSKQPKKNKILWIKVIVAIK
jgi:hypothetical protein